MIMPSIASWEAETPYWSKEQDVEFLRPGLCAVDMLVVLSY
jgi:hypothetical protein